MLDLAPTNLTVLRPERFAGAGFTAALESFAPADQQHLRQLTAVVQQLHELFEQMQAAPDLARFRAHLALWSDQAFLTRIHTLGQATRQQEPSALVDQLLYDLKEAGLAVLLGSAAWLRRRPANERLLTTCALAARDHARILRHAIADQDSAPSVGTVHTVAELVGRWDQAALHLGDRLVRVLVQARYTGGIAASDPEAAALSRVFYNYLHNAARFTANNRVEVTVLAVNPAVIRWVLSHPLTPAQQGWLETWTGGEPVKLYHSGQRPGRSACADLVAASLGLESPQQAVAEGYLGATLIGGWYHSWFHWPAL
jgi:hypothetical protein